ncbi:MAG: hypothetical protein OEW75_12095 [Cyclobacteriaceae bacterium]|nr:hypothetical protein [Cyclobacteriaceae bacterium]
MKKQNISFTKITVICFIILSVLKLHTQDNVIPSEKIKVHDKVTLNILLEKPELWIRIIEIPVVTPQYYYQKTYHLAAKTSRINKRDSQ